MKKLLALLLLLPAACDRGAEGNASAPTGEAVPAEGGSGVPATAAATAGLTGLYESGDGAQKNQLCIVDRGSGDAQFGLLVWGANLHSCSGAGTAVRSGERLTLTMAGDRSCTIEAAMVGGAVTLPASLPEGCAYYCGARARMEGTSFMRTGATAADAMKARDLADDPLCG